MNPEKDRQKQLQYTQVLDPEVDQFLIDVFRGYGINPEMMDPSREEFIPIAESLFQGVQQIIEAYTDRHPEQTTYHIAKEVDGYTLTLTETPNAIRLCLNDSVENSLCRFTLRQHADSSFELDFSNVLVDPPVFSGTTPPPAEVTNIIRWAAGNIAAWQEPQNLSLPDEIPE